MPTPQTTFPAPTQPEMTFDAAPLDAATSPSTTPSTSPSTPNQANQPNQPDMTFDAQPLDAGQTQGGQTQGGQTQTVPPQPPPTDTPMFSANPTPSTMSGKMERWARNLNEDLRDGTDLTGIGTVLKKMGAHGLGDNPVGNFMGSVPLGLARALIGASELPQSGKRWDGTKDTVGGVLDVGTIPSAFVAPEFGEIAGQGFDAAATQAERAASAVGKAVSKPFSVDALQQPLQQGIRDVFATVAKDAGVTPTTPASIRDVATALSDSVRAKASALYGQLDAATGGRFQRFSDALENIDKGLRDAIGVDPEKEKQLIQRKTEVEAAQQAALDTARKAGVDPSLITKANQAWKQQAALSDLSNSIRQSVTGMRPELANAESSVEKLNPKALFAKLNRLQDKGRLADALGPEASQAILQHVDSAYLAAEKIANRNKWIANAAKAAGVSGIGYAAVKGLHGLLAGPE